MPMELRHVRYFVAVAEERNFTNAAARLNVAQSPLSQQIRKLEREIGVRLFDRTTRSVALTYAGEVFYDRVATLLALSDEAVEAARKASEGELGTLAVGFTGSATYELLPSLVQTYHDRHPDVTLDIHTDMVTPQQVRALLEGALDVGVLRPPVRAEELVVETLRTEPLVVLLASRNPIAGERELDLADLRGEWFVSYPSNPPSTMYSTMREACERAGFVPRIRHVAPDSAALVSLVAANTGIALVPASLRHLGIKGATFRRLRTPPMAVSLALAYREDRVDPLVRRFLEAARTVVRSRSSVEEPKPAQAEDSDVYFTLTI
ncbi:MAG: LysR family transcriptional regulator [Actinophytocola sp.]|nr:LysR family transcriptional regulator [Actinophytocola sp.]